jgi:hypothetical protein
MRKSPVTAVKGRLSSIRIAMVAPIVPFRIDREANESDLTSS